jgi:protein O-mannosyl-transferase
MGTAPSAKKNKNKARKDISGSRFASFQRISSGHAIKIACIIILGCLVYSNTFDSPFVFDDEIYIINSAAIKDPFFSFDSARIDALPGNVGTVREQFKNRIVGHFSLAVNYAAHGLNVRGFHLTNLLIHLLNALLVYQLVNLTFKSSFLKERSALDLSFNADTGKSIAFLCALLFVAHPVQTQAVTYISQRFTSLATFFCLLSLLLYIRARLSEIRLRRYFFLLISILSLLLAMKTKEISFTLPVIIALYEFMFLEGKLKDRIIFLSPFLLAMTIIPLTLIYSAPSGESMKGFFDAAKETATINRSDYLMTQFTVVLSYIRLLLLPYGQNIDHDQTIYNSFFVPQVWLPFLLLVSIFIFSAYLFNRSRKETASSWAFRLLSFGIFYFFIPLSVESSIIPIKDVMFEHRVYLPSFGIFLCIATGAVLLKARLRQPLNRVVIPVMLLLIIILAVTAYARNSVWSSPMSLWKDAVAKSPLKARPHTNLGLAYFNSGDIGAAEAEYLTAIKLMPNHPDAYNNLGLVYLRKGKTEEAKNEFMTAIRLKPVHHLAHNNLGLCYDRLGRFDQAVKEFSAAIELRPDYVEAHNNLAITLYKQGLFEDSRKRFLHALELNPARVETHRNLAAFYENRGELNGAITEYRAIVRLAADKADAYRSLGVLYRKLNRFDEAVEAYREAIRLQPGIAVSHNNLGYIYEQQGRFEDAISEYLTALSLDPKNPETHFGLGLCYFKKNESGKALVEFRAALALDPKYADARKYVEHLSRQASLRGN